jgi:DNA-binding protein H-NS
MGIVVFAAQYGIVRLTTFSKEKQHMATLESVQTKIAKLQTQAAALAARDSARVIGKIRSLMEQHALTIADTEASVGKGRGRIPGASASAKQEASAAKYADPKTGATWTGHGRAPAWIANANDRNKFLITGTPAKSAATPQKNAKSRELRPGPTGPDVSGRENGSDVEGFVKLKADGRTNRQSVGFLVIMGCGCPDRLRSSHTNCPDVASAGHGE